MANKVLEKTVDLMLSEDYELRFLAEYRQTVNRRNNLKKMLKKYDEGTLEFEPNCPIDILKEQLAAMNVYVDVLKKRAKIEHINLSYRG